MTETSKQNLPLCACGEFYQDHHPECPALRAFELQAQEIKRLQARVQELERYNVGLATESERRRAALPAAEAAKRWHHALSRLVTLKAYKDAHGKDAYYEAEQPEAWAQAKRALESSAPETPPSRSVQRRVAAQRGEPVPEFGAEGKADAHNIFEPPVSGWDHK